MKCCILGNTRLNYSWFVKTFTEGLQLNDCEVIHIDYKTNTIDSIKDLLIYHKPLYTFTHLTFHQFHDKYKMLQLFSDLSKQYDMKFIHTCGDARSIDRYNDDISESFYAAFVGTYGLVENGLKNWKIPTYYSPYASMTYDHITEPIKKLKYKNPVFTGNPDSHKDRKDFISLLREYGVRLQIFKTQSSNDMRNKTAELSSSALCILGLCTGYDVDGFIDVRPYQYLGTAACMIMRKYKNMDDVIPDNLYYPFNTYDRKDAKYVKDVWQKIMKTDTWPMRCKAFRFIQRYHSSKVRLSNILNVLEGKQDSTKSTIKEFM